jgi:hypothetical protein
LDDVRGGSKGDKVGKLKFIDEDDSGIGTEDCGRCGIPMALSNVEEKAKLVSDEFEAEGVR